jgi:UDP-2-acetamido-2-deoxy-ribo-hexuluronate aminotransferase
MSNIAFIDLKTQFKALEPQIRAAMDAVLEHGQFIMGPEIKDLETKLAKYVGVPHAITTASGTDSLEIALRAFDIGQGDEVITVPFTWISTAEVIGQVGARPVFIDIEPDTYNMNVDQLEAAITPRTKAIMPVSLFGQLPDLESINRIAAKHGGIPVIEDAAQSFGATRHGRRSCSATTIGSTSFFPAKPLGCYGDGGALFTADDALAEKMRAIRTHGGLKRHHHPYIGMNGRFDTLQAAIILAKLPRFDWEVEQRGKIGARYTALLKPLLDDTGKGKTPIVAEGNTHMYAQYTIRLTDRTSLQEKLKAKGIPTAVYYPKCIHEQPAFAFCGYQPQDFPESMRASQEVVSLPMHPDLSESDQDIIVAAIKSALE